MPMAAGNGQRKRVRASAPFLFSLAATAVIVAAAVAQQVATAAVAQQEDDQNDPANITAAETVIVTHNPYLRNFLRLFYRSFQDIPQQ